MANSDVTRKLHVYRALFRLNRAFVLIARNLDQLLITGFFKEDIPDEDHPLGWQAQMAEVQCEINRRLTENLHRMEHGDIMDLARVEGIDKGIRKAHYPKPEKKSRR